MKKKFKRQCFWLVKLGEKWTKPRGRQSKLRREKKGRWAVPKIGYGNPRDVEYTILYKGTRKIPVMVKNLKDLESINPQKEVGIISSSIGKKKTAEMLEKASKIGVEIANRKMKKQKK